MYNYRLNIAVVGEKVNLEMKQHLTPHCGACHTVVHATQWCTPHCGTCHTVVHATLWYMPHCGARHTVVHATLWCMLQSLVDYIIHC